MLGFARLIWYCVIYVLQGLCAVSLFFTVYGWILLDAIDSPL